MRSAAATRLLVSRVRIPPGEWMFVVNVVCCAGRGLGLADYSSRGVLLNVCHSDQVQQYPTAPTVNR